MTAKTGLGGLRCIAFFKLFKALALLTVMATSLNLIRHEPTQVITRWALRVHVDPDNYYMRTLLAWLLHVDHRHLELFAIGAGVYALLFAVEGVGLWFARTWAEYLTLLSTGGLLPVEVYELLPHRSITKCVVLMLNIAIVAYLIKQVRKQVAVRDQSTLC